MITIKFTNCPKQVDQRFKRSSNMLKREVITLFENSITTSSKINQLILESIINFCNEENGS